MVEAVLEFAGRFILAIVLLFVFLPVALVAAGPFILVGSAFFPGTYAREGLTPMTFPRW